MTTTLLCTTALTISPETDSQPLCLVSPTLNGLEIFIQASWIEYRFDKNFFKVCGSLFRMFGLPVVAPGFNSARMGI